MAWFGHIDDSQRPNKVTTFRRLLPQFLESMAKNLIVVNKALFDGFPSIVIAALGGHSPELNPNETVKLDPGQISWLSTFAFIMHPIGGVVGGKLCDKHGRTKVMMVITVPILIAFVALGFSTSYEVICIGFATLGFVFGMKEAPTITYVSEISEPSIRGTIMAIGPLASSIGLFILYLLGSLMSWRQVSIVCAFFPVAIFIAVFLIPESPIWLLSVQRSSQALCLCMEKRKIFSEKIILQQEKKCLEIKTNFEKQILKEIAEKSGTDEETEYLYGDSPKLIDSIQGYKGEALLKFSETETDDDTSTNFREQLSKELTQFGVLVIEALSAFNKSLDQYTNSMQDTIAESEPFMDENELFVLHQKVKAEAIEQTLTNLTNGELSTHFRQKVSNDIDSKFISISQQNEKKRRDFVEKADARNEQIRHKIAETWQSSAISEIQRRNRYMTTDAVRNLHRRAKQSALNEFDSKKIGGIDIASSSRQKLDMELDRMLSTLNQQNQWKIDEYNARERREQQQREQERYAREQQERWAQEQQRVQNRQSKTRRTIISSVLGGALGFLVGGPTGAVIGAAAFGGANEYAT